MRNDRNFITWDPDGESLAISPRLEELNIEEVDQFYDRQIAFEIEEDRQVIYFNQSVRISSKREGLTVKIYLLIEGTPPYSLGREGTEITSRLQPNDFPYEDTLPEEAEGEYCYTITDQASDTDETCVII